MAVVYIIGSSSLKNSPVLERNSKLMLLALPTKPLYHTPVGLISGWNERNSDFQDECFRQHQLMYCLFIIV